MRHHEKQHLDGLQATSMLRLVLADADSMLGSDMLPHTRHALGGITDLTLNLHRKHIVLSGASPY